MTEKIENVWQVAFYETGIQTFSKYQQTSSEVVTTTVNVVSRIGKKRTREEREEEEEEGKEEEKMEIRSLRKKLRLRDKNGLQEDVACSRSQDNQRVNRVRNMTPLPKSRIRKIFNCIKKKLQKLSVLSRAALSSGVVMREVLNARRKTDRKTIYNRLRLEKKGQEIDRLRCQCIELVQNNEYSDEIVGKRNAILLKMLSII